ncbi:MAG: NADP-dependent malic enzyme [Clostridiales bacterium]|uniref:NAD(P)-dependent malic enzyme n=1 Tax=Evtepia sp. TaxID=2773933 RepID=UPI0029862843|nr:NADP-dependent malic enzyme [Evtepia sp.]MDD7288355.1 NADP-dependent malic enzyme [Clostridiales bacterium]MDY4430180.1 NADP-dependent malic enzyme [Evtepia sp.]
MDISAESLALHYELKGKLEVVSRYPVKTQKDLSLAYTPGVAAPCLEIQKDPSKSFALTRRQNMVAVITDGSAVLGLGNIGPAAGMPVMEGKCVLFKEFAGVDAFPLCVDTQDVDEMVKTIALISKSFGGINLEDISAPRCFEVERRLKEVCDIPVFHDDQHGTAVVITAALTNALKVVGKKKEAVRVVINGIGAAGSAAARLLLDLGFANMTLCDKDGILWEGDPSLSPHHAELAARTNREGRRGSLADALVGADVFIGVSRPGLVTGEMVETMAKDPIILAMANPVPEIMPDVAKAHGAAVVGTGRSDFPNQINNVLVFPGLFKGALSCGAVQITEGMKHAAAKALADMVPPEQLSAEYILPSPLNRDAAQAVADAVAGEARRAGIARF